MKIPTTASNLDNRWGLHPTLREYAYKHVASAEEIRALEKSWGYGLQVWRTAELDRRILEDKDGRVIADLRSWHEYPDDGKLLAASREMYDFLESLARREVYDNYYLTRDDFKNIEKLLTKAGRRV